MESKETFSLRLAEATVEYPRNSEGDVIALKDGALLACWTRFYGGTEDSAAAHIAARISVDGGRTWDAPFVLQENIGRENVMSASLLRERSSHDILFFYLVKNSLSDLKLHCRRSCDEGKTWAAPVLVTLGDAYHVVNNARIVQLSSGRMLAPCAYAAAGPPEWSFRTVIFYSDDGGRNWSRAAGQISAPKRGAMEPGVIELRDGRVLQIIRTQLGQIWKAYSEDRGLTWTQPEALGVPAPEAPSTISRIPMTGDLVLFYNPVVDPDHHHRGTRYPLSVAISRDEGLTWLRTVDLETHQTHEYAYLSCTFHADRALLTYYVGNMPLPSGPEGLSQKFVSLPISALCP